MKSVLINTIVASVLATASVAAAPRVQIQDTVVNKPLPDEIVQRIGFSTIGIYKDNPAALLGMILQIDSGNGGPISLSDDNIRAQLKVNRTKLLLNDKPVKRYECKIDKNLTAKGSYLIFASNLSNTSKAEVLITDLSSVAIGPDELPWDELRKLNVPPEKKLYFVRGVTLSNVAYKVYTKVSREASVTGGVFAVGGEAYSSNDEYSLDFRIGLNVIPITAEFATFIEQKKSAGLDGKTDFSYASGLNEWLKLNQNSVPTNLHKLEVLKIHDPM